MIWYILLVDFLSLLSISIDKFCCKVNIYYILELLFRIFRSSSGSAAANRNYLLSLYEHVKELAFLVAQCEAKSKGKVYHKVTADNVAIIITTRHVYIRSRSRSWLNYHVYDQLFYEFQVQIWLKNFVISCSWFQESHAIR